MELWALLSITAPGLFPSPQRFTEYYRGPIERGQNAELLAQLRRRIRPLMLRRTKEQVGTRPARRSRSRCSSVRAEPAAPQGLPDRTCSGSGRRCSGCSDDMDRNRFDDLPVADPAAAAQPGRRPRRREPRRRRRPPSSTRFVEQLRRDGRRGAPRAGLQPVHRLPRPRCATGWTPPASSTATSTGAPATGPASIDGFKTGDGPGVPHQPQGRRVRAEPHRGRLLLPAGPVVEPGHRGAGRRPDPPDRAGPAT